MRCSVPFLAVRGMSAASVNKAKPHTPPIPEDEESCIEMMLPAIAVLQPVKRSQHQISIADSRIIAAIP